MKTNCQACGKQLKLGEKLVASIEKMDPGKTIRIKCPKCGEAVLLDHQALSPSIIAEQPDPGPVVGKKLKVRLKPPAPPDITWLEDGVYDEETVIEDVPLALIVMPDSPERDTVIESIEGIGYKTDVAQSAGEAIEKMQFVVYSAVVHHTSFEGGGLQSSSFHEYMCGLHMSRRRFIYYILVGREFKTLYNLQALAHSANLVVNDVEVPYFGVIIRKSIPEYEELFGPIMEELRIHGK